MRWDTKRYILGHDSPVWNLHVSHLHISVSTRIGTTGWTKGLVWYVDTGTTEKRNIEKLWMPWNNCIQKQHKQKNKLSIFYMDILGTELGGDSCRSCRFIYFKHNGVGYACLCFNHRCVTCLRKFINRIMKLSIQKMNSSTIFFNACFALMGSYSQYSHKKL